MTDMSDELLESDLRDLVSWLLGARLAGHELRAVHAAETIKRAIDALHASIPGGVGVKGLDDEDLASDERWNAGVNYAIERLCEVFGIDPKTINWDAATETLNGDVMSVICGVLTTAYGEEWSSDEQTTRRIKAALDLSPAEHSDDLAVDQFAAAMKAKLAKKRGEGLGGWDRKDECTAEFLSQLLREHVEKGDPLDVGNLAMMLQQRGERITK